MRNKLKEFLPMSRICVTRHIEFEAAHMLTGYNGPCGSLHGHSYKLEVTITCPESIRTQNDFGFVTDFKNLNKILKENVPDHYFMYNKNATEGSVELTIANLLKVNGLNTWEFDGYPSAENMARELALNFQKILDDTYSSMQMKVTTLKLWETTDSHATWTLDSD